MEMHGFGSLSIRHKLTLLSVVASGSALLLACAAFVGYDFWTFREAILMKLSTQARMVGYNSSAAIEFGDRRAATEILAAFGAESDIIAAATYSRDGQMFARYQRGDAALSVDEALPASTSALADHHRFGHGYLELVRPIIFDGKPMGAVAIRADLSGMGRRLARYMSIALVIFLFCVTGSVLVARTLQHRISQPILNLAETARAVSLNQDYSLRAAATGQDEVSRLIETFNDMLATIQEKNTELKDARDDLERRVIERTAQLEQANKELEAFSYSVSHDLRGPLRAIDGFSQALLEDYIMALDAQGQDYLRRVRAASQRMAQLIDDLLMLSRMSREALRREVVDLSILARAILADLKDAEPQRRVEICVSDGVAANGDARLLRVVLENLLRNAWKFTSKHDKAKIEFGVSQSNGNPIYFVRDDGAGFDAAYVDKLFGPFQRLHASSEFEGTGIGLATVQRIIHRHGGKVWAEAILEQGATFHFTLG
jgi:signal transduction histidine kinase